jgi:hypothetical protein
MITCILDVSRVPNRSWILPTAAVDKRRVNSTPPCIEGIILKTEVSVLGG